MSRFRTWRRWLLDILGATVTLLTLLMAIAWIDSYWRVTSIDYRFEVKRLLQYSSVYVQSEMGTARLIVSRMRIEPEWDVPSQGSRLIFVRRSDPRSPLTLIVNSPPWYQRLGFSLRSNEYQILDCTFPWWAPWLSCVAVAVPWLWTRRKSWRAEHRHKRNLCVTCGYDLRGSTDKCPECHTAIPVKSAESNPLQTPSDALGPNGPTDTLAG